VIEIEERSVWFGRKPAMSGSSADGPVQARRVWFKRAGSGLSAQDLV